MATSDAHLKTAAETQLLLRALFTSPASETASECRDAKVLEVAVQDAVNDLAHHSFGSVNPRHVSAKATGVASMLSRHAQTSKLSAFRKLQAEYVPSSSHLLPLHLLLH